MPQIRDIAHVCCALVALLCFLRSLRFSAAVSFFPFAVAFPLTSASCVGSTSSVAIRDSDKWSLLG